MNESMEKGETNNYNYDSTRIVREVLRDEPFRSHFGSGRICIVTIR